MIRRDRVQSPAPGTDTTHGRIPHLKVVTSYGVVEAPVSVDLVRVQNGPDDYYLGLRPRMNEFGRYLHVLPGGMLVPGSHVSR